MKPIPYSIKIPTPIEGINDNSNVSFGSLSSSSKPKTAVSRQSRNGGGPQANKNCGKTTFGGGMSITPLCNLVWYGE